MARIQPSPFNIGGAANPLGHWSARGVSFAALAALIVRLPVRKDVGLRNLSWSCIIVVTIGMLVLQWFDNVHLSLFSFFGGGVSYSNHAALRNYALAWFAFAAWEHFKRLSEEKRGVEPHNFSPGTSRLGLTEFLPFTPKVIAVAVEPALAFLCGALMRRFGFSMLGWALMGAALCFAGSEWQLYQQTREHRRDMRDLAKEGHWQSALMKQNPGEQGELGPEAIHTGITGLEHDIEDRMRAGGSAAQGGVKWQELDARARRKALVVLAVVASAVAALVWPSGTHRMRLAPRPSPLPSPLRTTQQPRGRQAGPAAAPVSSDRPPNTPPVPVAPPRDAGMLGKWQSAPMMLANRGICTLWVEMVRKPEEPDKYTGAATLSCAPSVLFGGPKANVSPAMMLARLNPLSAVMSGVWASDSIAFRVDKVLNAGGCAWKGFSVSRFGSQNVAAEFEDGCGGGSMVLRRAG
jgi:hypothetical protein